MKTKPNVLGRQRGAEWEREREWWEVCLSSHKHHDCDVCWSSPTRMPEHADVTGGVCAAVKASCQYKTVARGWASWDVFADALMWISSCELWDGLDCSLFCLLTFPARLWLTLPLQEDDGDGFGRQLLGRDECRRTCLSLCTCWPLHWREVDNKSESFSSFLKATFIQNKGFSWSWRKD